MQIPWTLLTYLKFGVGLACAAHKSAKALPCSFVNDEIPELWENFGRIDPIGSWNRIGKKISILYAYYITNESKMCCDD